MAVGSSRCEKSAAHRLRANPIILCRFRKQEFPARNEVEILAAIRAGAKAIFVNLANASFLCSAGIRVLLQYHRQMKGKGHTFLVSRPSAEVAAALEMTGFPELVEP